MSTPYQLIDVAVVLITNPERDRLLLDHNPRWGEFIFPMTKLGQVPGSTPGSPPSPEAPTAAAVRAAVEVLGHPLSRAGLPAPLEFEVEPYHRSGRDGVWKRYKYHLFTLNATSPPRPLPGHVSLWLAPADLETCEPVSPTIRIILGAVPLSALGL